ncbi:MAG: hypothetical protein H6711_00455 [Myxococcales bacterium]|nr:hypothetical protein [Myxococcales bacterium]
MRSLLLLLPPLALACACFPSSAFETWGSGADAASEGSTGTTGTSAGSSGDALTSSGGSSDATTTTGVDTSTSTATSTSSADATSDEPTTGTTSGADTSTSSSTSGDPPCQPAVLVIAATRDAFALDGGVVLCSTGFGSECKLLNGGITKELAVGGNLFYQTDFYADFALGTAIAEAGYAPADVSSIRLHVWVRSDPKESAPATTWAIGRIKPDQVWLEGTKDRKLAASGDSSFLHRMIDGDAQILWSGGDGPAGASTEIATLQLAAGVFVEATEFVSGELVDGLAPWLADPTSEQGLTLAAKTPSAHILQARESGKPPTLEVHLCE